MRLHFLTPLIIGTVGLLRPTSGSSYNNYGSNTYDSEYNNYGSSQPGSCNPSPGSIIQTQFPLYFDFFPYTTPGSENDTDVAKRAHGIRSNGPLPQYLSKQTITALQVAVLNGYYAVAYLVQFLTYIYNEKPGYYIANTSEREYAIAALVAFLAQEEQHTLGANGLLARFGAKPIQPCKYYYPPTVTDYSSSIDNAGLQVEILSGFLQSLVQLAGNSGDSQILRIVASVIQNEASQAGWYRSVNGRIPSPNAFPTPVPVEYYFSYLLQRGIVPGSCPDTAIIDLPVFGALVVVQPPLSCTDVDQLVQFSIQSTSVSSLTGRYIAYINQQNDPVVVPIVNLQIDGDCVSFFAYFPCSLTTFGQGLTLAAVVNQTESVITVDTIVKYTEYGPGVIYFN